MTQPQPSQETILKMLTTLNDAHQACQTAKKRKDREQAATTVTDCKRWFEKQGISCFFSRTGGQYVADPYHNLEKTE